MDYTKDYIITKINDQTIKLSPSQNKLSLPIIERITRKMKFGIRFDDIKIEKGLIIDGHHRYISSLIAGIELKSIVSARTTATIEYNWESVNFVNEEWDTLEKIVLLNEKDAHYNNLSIEKINEIIK
ncbi:MAG: hypothetical protein ACK5UE_11775 [Chitinophagales bacterium]|jgi:hypothetical protein|nr:hypothetical protein [Sphingobacteriales bacterium]